MTTQGPMSSRWRDDFRWVTCLNMKGLEEACSSQPIIHAVTYVFFGRCEDPLCNRLCTMA